jgi:hypothetical protein
MITFYYFFAFTAPLPITDEFYQRRTHLNKVRP